MDILAAIKREEKKLEKQLGKLQHQLTGIRAAAKALGDSTSREVTTVKNRVLSAAARANISKATKKWAKFRAKAKKAVGQRFSRELFIQFEFEFISAGVQPPILTGQGLAADSMWTVTLFPGTLPRSRLNWIQRFNCRLLDA
jgi:hypothetical protein